MSEYIHVESTFLEQLAALGWTVIDQGSGIIPSFPAASLRTSFREWLLPEVFRTAVCSINTTDAGETWLTDRQLDELRDQILRQPNRTLLEANEAIQALLFKAQVDKNEITVSRTQSSNSLISIRLPITSFMSLTSSALILRVA